MESKIIYTESLIESTVQFTKTSCELYKLKAIDKTAEVFSNLISNSVTYLILIFAMINITIGLAIWIGNVIGKLYFGFIIVGGLFIISGLIFNFILIHRFRKSLINSIISKMN